MELVGRFLSLASNKLFINAILAFSLKVVGAGASFLSMMVVARALGPHESGLYFLAFSIVTFASAVGRIGLDSTVVRFTSSGIYSVSNVLIKSLCLGFFATFVVTALMYFSVAELVHGLIGRQELGDVLKSVVFSIPLLSIIAIVASSLQGRKRTASSLFVLNIGVHLFVVIGVWAGEIHAAVGVGEVFTVATVLVSMLGLTLWLQGKRRSVGRVIEWRILFDSCLPLAIVLIVNQTIQWSGQIIAGVLLEAEDVAFLAVAQRTAMLTSFVLMAVNWVVVPRISRCFFEKDFEGVRRLTTWSIRLMTLTSLPIVLAMLIYPDFFVQWFGDGFKDAETLLVILVLGQFFNVVTGPAVHLLMMSGNEKKVRSMSLVAGAFSLLVTLVFTWLFGLYGCAIATALSVCFYNFLAVIYVRNLLRMNVFYMLFCKR